MNALDFISQIFQIQLKTLSVNWLILKFLTLYNERAAVSFSLNAPRFGGVKFGFWLTGKLGCVWVGVWHVRGCMKCEGRGVYYLDWRGWTWGLVRVWMVTVRRWLVWYHLPRPLRAMHMPCTTHTPTHAQPSLPVNQNQNLTPPNRGAFFYTWYCCLS